MEPEGSLPQCARHLSLSWASSIHSISPQPISWRSILILYSHLRLCLPSGLFPSGFPAKTLYTPLLSPIRYRNSICPNIKRGTFSDSSLYKPGLTLKLGKNLNKISMYFPEHLTLQSLSSYVQDSLIWQQVRKSRAPLTLKSKTLSSDLFTFSLYKSLLLRIMQWHRWWKASNCDINYLNRWPRRLQESKIKTASALCPVFICRHHSTNFVHFT